MWGKCEKRPFSWPDRRQFFFKEKMLQAALKRKELVFLVEPANLQIGEARHARFLYARLSTKNRERN